MDIVEADGAGPHAGVLFLHWYDPPSPTSDRTEFRAEAAALARRGVVSFLPDLTFPWVDKPVGDASDRRRVGEQVDRLRAALAALAARPDVDADRIAVVGHDYGGMYGLLLDAPNTVVMNVDATFGNWFATYFLGLSPTDAVAYEALFDGVDPVTVVGRRTTPLLLQFAEPDGYVPASTRRALVSAAAAPKECRVYPDAGHELDDRARADRSAWLAARLGL